MLLSADDCSMSHEIGYYYYSRHSYSWHCYRCSYHLRRKDQQLQVLQWQLVAAYSFYHSTLKRRWRYFRRREKRPELLMVWRLWGVRSRYCCAGETTAWLLKSEAVMVSMCKLWMAMLEVACSSVLRHDRGVWVWGVRWRLNWASLK